VNLKRDHPKAVYLLLLALPEFRQLALNPGEQLRYIPFNDFATIGILFVTQVACWHRLLRISIPFQDSKSGLKSCPLFVGRLSFIFREALFSAAFFRHLPELRRGADVLLTARRGVLLCGALFALFCFALELERLGQGLGSGQRN
jgi:hypothetical protein